MRGILGLGEDIPDDATTRSFTPLHVGNNVEGKTSGIETNGNRLHDGVVPR